MPHQTALTAPDSSKPTPTNLRYRSDREEVEDAIEIEIRAKLETVIAMRITHDIDELRALDGRFARTKIVSSQLEETAAGLNTHFSNFAIRFAGFASRPN